MIFFNTNNIIKIIKLKIAIRKYNRIIIILKNKYKKIMIMYIKTIT